MFLFVEIISTMNALIFYVDNAGVTITPFYVASIVWGTTTPSTYGGHPSTGGEFCTPILRDTLIS